MTDSKPTGSRYYFVDEAGDLTLFSKGGKTIIGTEGCSKFFILGTAHIEDPHRARSAIHALRQEILRDPYLTKVPSLQPNAGKTALLFHAKDDISEVRRDVFKLFQTLPIRIFAIVRRKSSLVEFVKRNNSYDSNWHYNPNKVYDACVKRLFKDRLHKAEENHIVFARRGKSDRNNALLNELNKAKQNFETTHSRQVVTKLLVYSNYPSQEPCLQIIDYYVWALQRLYERGEERYFQFAEPKFERIIDLDDKSQNDYGTYYDKRNPLAWAKIKDSLEG